MDIQQIKAFIDADQGLYIQPVPVRNEATAKILNKLVPVNERVSLPSTPGVIQAALSAQPAKVQTQVLYDEIMNDPAQAAANKTIADQLNALEVVVGVNYVSWQDVLSAIGGTVITNLTQLKTDQLLLIKSESVNPQDAEFIAAVLGITGVDISSLATKTVSWPESKGWRKLRPGEIGMARNLV